jgi:Fe-S cluster assembly iron-binding protein IscA
MSPFRIRPPAGSARSFPPKPASPLFACPWKAADARDFPTSSISPTNPADDDIVLEKDDAKVLIDQVSLVYMAGSEIDFVDNLMGQAFQIRNPNAVASCGCGTSFSV